MVWKMWFIIILMVLQYCQQELMLPIQDLLPKHLEVRLYFIELWPEPVSSVSMPVDYSVLAFIWSPTLLNWTSLPSLTLLRLRQQHTWTTLMTQRTSWSLALIRLLGLMWPLMALWWNWLLQQHKFLQQIFIRYSLWAQQLFSLILICSLHMKWVQITRPQKLCHDQHYSQLYCHLLTTKKSMPCHVFVDSWEL